MPTTPIIRFIPCCAPEGTSFIFTGVPIIGIPNNSYWVYTGVSEIFGDGTAPWNSLIPGQCYTVFYNTLPFIFPSPTPFPLDINSFSNSSLYFPRGQTCEESVYCQEQCSDPLILIPQQTVTFIPCCDLEESIIFNDVSPYLSSFTTSGNIFKYMGNQLTGTGLGPLGLDVVNTGFCYRVNFGQSTTLSYPVLPSNVTLANFSSTQNNCFHPSCPVCDPIVPFTDRYYKLIPCCDITNPLYFRVGPDMLQEGVAVYNAIISGNPFFATDKYGLPAGVLDAGLCYSIIWELASPTSYITNSTEYNNLNVAPPNSASNFTYISQIPDCTTSIAQRLCPECEPNCYTLYSCDGETPLITSYSTFLFGFIGQNIIVSSVDPNDGIVEVCVFVGITLNANCTNAIDLELFDDSCECPCICYTVIGSIKQIDFVDCFGNEITLDLPISPYIFCSQVYPLAYPNSDVPLIITDSGLCEEVEIINPETCDETTEFLCPIGCYKLTDCLDDNNIIYSNSPTLLIPASLNQVVTIVGYTECWIVSPSIICDCLLSVTILTISDCCLSCLPNINYKLTSCDNLSTISYTSSDLSLYVDKVITREDCQGCWIVSEIQGNIPSDTDIVVLEEYLNCDKCYRQYYLLEDCLGLQNDIITYTDLSDYANKVITLGWCPETCWEVSRAITDTEAGIISDILNSYTECIDCLTNAPCICSTIKNYNDIALEYKYLDCEGILQTITLQPGKKSRRLCLIRWYVPEPCDELIVTITSSVGVVSNIILYQNSVNHPGPVIVNNKPTWKDAGNNLYVYYDGTKWILSKNFTPLVLPSVYTTIGFINCNGDCDCPTGTWQQSSSIPNQDVYVTTEFKYTIEYFGNCINGRCPAVKNKQKVIKPGYKTCACETWKYEEVSCKAAEALYKQVLQLRYGISNCCPEEDERYIVQKELIDLQCIIPPVEETPNCFFGLVLETIYLGEYSDIALLPLEWQNIGLGDPSSTCGLGVGCHGCNNALFELEADSVSLGESKMNNAGGDITTGSTTSYGTVICGDYDNTPAPLTGGSWTGNASSRYSKIVVDEDIAQALADATSGGVITISALCSKQLYNCTAPSCSCESGFDGGCHTNVTFLRVTQGNILLYAGGIGGDIQVTIDPCSPVPIPPLPPLVINTIYTTFSAVVPPPPPPPPPCATCTTIGRVPQFGNSVTHNGVVISASGTGTIGMTTYGYLGFMCPLPVPASTMSTVTLGQGTMFIPAPFIYTLTFSVPVNNIVIRLYSYQASNPISPPPSPSFIYPFAESFTFTTNTGSQIPLISSCEYCCGIINANTITAANTSLLCDQWSSGFLTIGNGIFTISNSLPFTTLTVAGPGGLDGSIMDICTDSLIPVPPSVFSYNCVNGNCVFVSGPSGTYPTLAACTNACISPVITYDCTNGNCVLVSGPGGQYPTLLACQNNCGSANTIYTTFDII